MAKAAGFLVQVGLISSVPVAVTGFIDWWRLPRYTPTWKTGLFHLIVTGIASVLFSVTFRSMVETVPKGVIPTRSFALMLVAYALMAFGGWLGGKLVFVFGYRVLPAEAAASGEARAR